MTGGWSAGTCGPRRIASVGPWVRVNRFWPLLQNDNISRTAAQGRHRPSPDTALTKGTSMCPDFDQTRRALCPGRPRLNVSRLPHCRGHDGHFARHVVRRGQRIDPAEDLVHFARVAFEKQDAGWVRVRMCAEYRVAEVRAHGFRGGRRGRRVGRRQARRRARPSIASRRERAQTPRRWL